MKRSCCTAAVFLCARLSGVGQTIPPKEADRIAPDVSWALRRSAAEDSQILRTVHILADRYGPRLTGSPAHEAAAKWVAATLSGWGLENSHLESWNFGHTGWSNREASGYIISPAPSRLNFEVQAWTPSTRGKVAGDVVQITPPRTPTQDQLSAWLAQHREDVRGKVVLVGRAAHVEIAMNPSAKRFETSELRANLSGSGDSSPEPARKLARLSRREIDERVNRWLKDNGALVKLEDSGRPMGQIRALGSPTYNSSDTIPTVVLRNEDFGRLERLLADGENVRVEFDIQNSDYPAGGTSYNVVAEIPGREKNGEMVMFGAHLDSWHMATGATDNAIGCAVVMEAARILAASSRRPKRTVRVALWSGEEQGNLGSKAYVAEHFGTIGRPGAEFARLSAYLNTDMGTGRIRCLWLFGPSEGAAALQSALAPFADLGFVFAAASPLRAPGNSDHSAFSEAGLPAVNFVQDPIDYGSTWHTQLDTYERVLADDARQAATLVALAVWDLAERDTLLPRDHPAAPVP